MLLLLYYMKTVCRSEFWSEFFFARKVITNVCGDFQRAPAANANEHWAKKQQRRLRRQVTAVVAPIVARRRHLSMCAVSLSVNERAMLIVLPVLLNAFLPKRRSFMVAFQSQCCRSNSLHRLESRCLSLCLFIC